jgi:hypothetical protein
MSLWKLGSVMEKNESSTVLNSVHPEFSWFFFSSGLLGTTYPRVPRLCSICECVYTFITYNAYFKGKLIPGLNCQFSYSESHTFTNSCVSLSEIGFHCFDKWLGWLLQSGVFRMPQFYKNKFNQLENLTLLCVSCMKCTNWILSWISYLYLFMWPLFTKACSKPGLVSSEKWAYSHFQPTCCGTGVHRVP